MASSVQVDQQTPPSAGNVTDAAWQRFFNSLYDAALRSGGSFPSLNIIGKETVARATTERFYYNMLSWNVGHYVDYTTQQGSIAYGFACAVRRQGGNAFTVGAQIDAIGSVGASNTLFGIAVESWAEKGFLSAILGQEIAVINQADNNLSAKWGLNFVFKNHTVTPILGANQYNWFTNGVVFTAQARSAAGEYVGWTRGISFFGDCFDLQTPPAWSATKIYQEGMVVTSGARSWQCILSHINQVPAVPSAYWVFNSPAGVRAAAVGIDFVSMGAGGIAAMDSAIRLRSFMRFHWEETGAIGTYFDSTTAQHILTENAGLKVFGVVAGGAAQGVPFTSKAQIALGGGAAPVLGTIGGAGPGVAAQSGWMQITMNGVQCFVPTWN